MAFQIDRFEWKVGEEHWARSVYLWESSVQSGAASRVINESRLVLAVIRALSLLLFAALLVAGSPLTHSHLKYERLHETAASLLRHEAQLWKRNDRVGFARLIDDGAEMLWIAEWRRYWHQSVRHRAHFGETITHVETHDNLLFVEVLVTRPASDWWLVSPVRETRIYQKHDGAWQRTVPPVGFWGEMQSLETASLRIRYPQRNAALIAEIAPPIEESLVYLDEYLGLGLLTKDRKLTIHIAPSPQRGRFTRENRIDVTAPLLATIPHGLSDREYVIRFVTGQLVAIAINRKLDYSGTAYAYHWGMMTWAARGWLENRLMGEASPWFAQSEQIFLSYTGERLPIRLNDVTRVRTQGELRSDEHLYWQYVASELLLEYAVRTYGEETLKQLLKGFGQYESWNELVPELFGLPAKEFEADFNRFLVAKYQL